MEKWIVLASSILVLVFICWKETKRKNKDRISLRQTASIVAVLALYFIAQPIRFQRKLDPSRKNSVVILTEGFEKDSLSKLRNIPLYSTEYSVVEQNKDVNFIPDLAYFVQSQPDINKINIVGDGMEQHELEVFRNHQLIFHPGPVLGLNTVHWNNTLRSGEKLVVQGSFLSKSNKTVKILLRGLNTTLDSVELKATQNFELSTTPKLLGKAIFSLVALSGRDTLAQEKIPFIVASKTPLRILILSSSPDFETKFLKSWLYGEKYALAIRTNISKNKFSTEFLNVERMNLNRLSRALLENFDILLGDMAELNRLSAADNTVIQNQVSKGMGLVVRADSVNGTGFYRKAFNIRQNRAIDQKNISLSWAGQTSKKASAPSGWALNIVPGIGEQVLVKDNKNHVFVSSKLYGKGRMIFSTVSDTYTWMLNNNSASYSAYWSHILEKAARESESLERWSISKTLPLLNSPTPILLESSVSNLPSATSGNSTLHFEQDPSQLFRWSADYWPSTTGWQIIRSANKESSWYVFDQNDWQSVRAAQKIKNTAKFISNSKTNTERAGRSIRTYTYTLPSVYFFMLFLVACGYLWVEGNWSREHRTRTFP